MVDANAGGVRTGDGELENRDDDSAIWGEDGVANAQVDDFADPVRSLEQFQRHAALNAAFDALEEAERYVMASLYRDDMTMREVGEVLGVSESRVSQMAMKIVAKLRVRLRAW